MHDFSSGLHRNSKALFEAMLSLKKASSFPHLIEIGIKHKHILQLFSTKGPDAFLAWTIGAKKSWQPNNATTRIVHVKITNSAYHNQNLMCNMPTQSGKGGHYEFSTKKKKIPQLKHQITTEYRLLWKNYLVDKITKNPI